MIGLSSQRLAHVGDRRPQHGRRRSRPGRAGQIDLTAVIAHLNEGETRLVRFLESAGGGLTDAQLRWLVREIGLAWTPIWRLLRSSPLFEQSPEGLFRLVGSG
jgi:hypothetical protein